MYCPQCGNKTNEHSKFCEECGTALKKDVNTPVYTAPSTVDSRKSRIVAGILQLFLGFGAGRFYLGYTKLAITQLVVVIFTFGLGSVWTLVDGILILVGNVETDAEGRSLKE